MLFKIQIFLNKEGLTTDRGAGTSGQGVRGNMATENQEANKQQSQTQLRLWWFPTGPYQGVEARSVCAQNRNLFSRGVSGSKKLTQALKKKSEMYGKDTRN